MKNRLNNKVALVTGGNSGIGQETVQRFVEEGATVYFTGRNPETITESVVIRMMYRDSFKCWNGFERSKAALISFS
jgi:NAD(P)-dependent dehydrogenase (short-subunit alcohol dehydrogenase family)